MTKHRSTQAKVSKDAENDNFDAGTALENLRAEVVDIAALARAAEAASEATCCASCGSDTTTIVTFA